MSSKTTSTTTVPEASDQEKQIMDLITGSLLPDYLSQAGYDVQTTQTRFEDSDQFKNLNAKLESLRSQKASGSKNLPPGANAQFNNQFNTIGPSTSVPGTGDIDSQIASVEGQIAKARASYTPAANYDVRKKDSPEVEQIRNKFGADSSEYRQAKEAETQRTVDIAKQQDRIYKTFRDKTEKYLNGDFSITPEQETLIQQNNAPVKKAIEAMFKDNYAESGKTFDDFNKEAEKSGMSFSQAMGSVVDQIKTTGVEMERALKNVVATREALLKQGIDDYTGEITKRVSQNAAAMGRDPSDPEYTADISDMVAKQVRGGQLELADMESQGLLGIRERTGGALEQAAYQKGSALTNYEQNLAKMRTDVGTGLPPSQLQVGGGGLQYEEALGLQRLQNAAGAAQFPSFFGDRMQRERLAQPTTTQRTPFGAADALSLGLGVAGMGANIYGAYGVSQALRGSGGNGYEGDLFSLS